MTSPTRLLADVDALLLDVLIAALGLPAGSVAEVWPSDYLGRMPFVQAHRVGGAPIHPRFYDSATCDVQCWADTRTAALDLGEACRTALYDACEQQTIYPHGSIASYVNTAYPVVIPSGVDNVTRVQATYRLGVCPPLT